MSWQVEDAAANRQGLTIAEFGELGGPGMGGCPAGPAQQDAPKPGEATVVRSADKTKVQVSWTPATPAPVQPPVTGYSVEAIAATKGAGGEQTGSLVRVPATATAATISNLVATENYSVEVRSITGTLLSDAFTAAAAGGGTGTRNRGQPPTPPSAGRPPGTTVPVTLTNAADGIGAEIYYTTDGSDPRVADLPSDKAIRYTAPITITAPNTTLNFVAFKADGSFSDTGTAGPFQPGASTGLPVPGVSVAGGIELATVKWALVSGATKYVVTATPPTPGGPVVVEAGATVTSVDVKPLVGGTSYNVTVAAANASGTGAASAPIAVTPAVNTVPRVSITSARYKTGDFRVVGTSSATSGTVSVYASNPNATPAPARSREWPTSRWSPPSPPPRARRSTSACVPDCPQAGPGLGEDQQRWSRRSLHGGQRLISCTTARPEGPPPTGGGPSVVGCSLNDGVLVPPGHGCCCGTFRTILGASTALPCGGGPTSNRIEGAP